MNTLQRGVCGICGQPPQSTRLHLDHQHQPKERQLKRKKEQHKIRAKVRGLLCWRCNTAIQKFRDNPKLLRAAAKYLDHPPAKEILKCRSRSTKKPVGKL
ncbi:MAG: endonuclease domain-containing protein [Nitrosotalea sp.]